MNPVQAQAQAMADGLLQLSLTDDPRVTVRLATELLDRLREAQSTVSRARDEAVLTLHASGNSLNDIARLSRLTRGRVFQIVQRGRDSEL